MQPQSKEIYIEVASLAAATPVLLSFKVAPGTTVEQVLALAKMDTDDLSIAVGGKIVDKQYSLVMHDRIDLLPSLVVTPEQARQLRKAKKQKQAAQAAT